MTSEKEKELAALRKEIDGIDDRMAALFNDRMRLAGEIGRVKAEGGGAVADFNREKSILNRVAQGVDADKLTYMKQVFGTLFDVSKAYQTGFVDTDSPIGRKIAEAAASTPAEFPVRATVACQGIEGAYSMLACEKLFALSDIMYFKDWNGVFNAIEKGLCRYGILPIENSTAGSVNTVYDLILSHKFYVVRTVSMRIKHSLLAKKGTSLQDVKEIYSHEQAVVQCSAFLSAHPEIKVSVVENTAVAARTVAESGRADVAAISSPECAEIYGLAPIASGVQNADENYTRFICISRDLEIYPNADRISLVMTLPHVTGSLNKLLSKFSSLGLNLTKLESRPIGTGDFEFAFYFDFEGDVRKEEVRNLISELSLSIENFSFLGCYSEIR